MDHAEANWGSVSTGTTFTLMSSLDAVTLAGGVDDNIVTNTELMPGWALFANPESVDIGFLIGGSADATLGQYLIQNIAEERKDCVAVISPLMADVVNNASSEMDDIITYRNGLTSSSYGILDCNWKYQFDSFNNTFRWIPCSADVAGLMARTDETNDPWWSPAGYNRGQIKNVVKLAWNPSKTERDELYQKGVNSIVTVAGEGTVLLGDKTMLAKPSAFDRINVRRLFIILEKAIAKASQYALFEFNDSFTRARFVQMVEPYLRDVQGRRGITGFRVICDETNNTGQVIDSNGFVGDIYIQPNRSINFITLNFVATPTGVDFEEVIGTF
jgi:phage tail sheath protein FI